MSTEQDFEFNQYIKQLQNKEFNDEADRALSEKYDRIVYVDMDGVLCDFAAAAAKFGFPVGPQDKESPNDNAMWTAIELYGKDKFFATLQWTPKGRELWKFVTDNFLNVKILTALGRSDQKDSLTSKGKRTWIHRNIPLFNEKNIIMVPNKHAKKYYAKSGDILIDDTEVCITDWNKKGGIGILHKDTAETIRRLEKYV